MTTNFVPLHARKVGDPNEYLLVGAPGDRGPLGPTGPEGLRGPQGASGPSVPLGAGSQHQVYTRDASGNGVWRTGQGWQVYDLLPYLEADWVSAGTDMSIQGIAYNSFYCMLNMKLFKHGAHPEDTWMTLVRGEQIPDFLKPFANVRDTVETVELDGWWGSHFAYRINATGNVDITMQGMSVDWGDRTVIAIRLMWPRKSWL